MHADSIVRVAGLIGEAGRIRMLTVLLDGAAHSATDLAMAAEVSPQTASSHLSKLLAGGLIVCERCGRQRLFRFQSADVASAIEALGALAPQPASEMPELRFARTCYDHLAGVLSIALTGELLRINALRHHGHEFALTPSGEKFLRSLDIDASRLRDERRSFARKCLDWTERHPHIGGSVGAALLSRFFERKWLARMRATRAVRITHEGERQFERVFCVCCPELRCRTPQNARR